MVISMLVSLYYGENFMPLLWGTALAVALGTMAVSLSSGAKRNMGRKDGYIVVTVVWTVFSLVGMLPFLIDGCIPDVASAFFETVSGFTSTGSTIINNVDIANGNSERLYLGGLQNHCRW